MGAISLSCCLSVVHRDSEFSGQLKQPDCQLNNDDLLL